jgi:hypothetical protein
LKVGDLITTYGEIPPVPTNGKDGDAYPCKFDLKLLKIKYVNDDCYYVLFY